MKTSPMSVQLVDHMGSDLTVVNAARVSFDKESELETLPYWMDDQVAMAIDCIYKATGVRIDKSFAGELSYKDAKLINYLAKHNHWSPFAHTSVQLRVKAPIFVARQLVKHQVGGVWNEVSRRYVDSEPEFWFPEVWRGRPAGSMKQGSSGEVVKYARLRDDNEEYVEYQTAQVTKKLTGWLARAYEDLIHSGVAPEQARMILPQNMMTEWYWTGSLMFFARVCRERLAPGAQLETRDVAEQIAEIVAPLFPVSWSALMGTSHE